MTSILSQSMSAPSLSPYHLHDKYYSNMFRHGADVDHDATRGREEVEDSFLVARMQFPPSLVEKSSHPRPIFHNVENERQPRARRRPSLESISKHSVSTAATVKAGTSRPRKQLDSIPKKQTIPKKQMSPEDKQMQQLYLEARRHEAATSRVTKLEDFRTMSFTLPAAKTSSPGHDLPTTSTASSSPSSSSSSPQKQCPWMIPTTSLTTKSKQGRKNAPMFRGKKAWTASAAAGSVVAEATQADRYYQHDQHPQRNLPRKSQSERRGDLSSSSSPVRQSHRDLPRKYQSERRAVDSFFSPTRLDHIDEDGKEVTAEEENQKLALRWKSFFPKRRAAAPRSCPVEV